MGLFSRRTPDLQPLQPFTFVIEDVFSVPTVGHVLTGRVTSGVMTKGQSAQLLLPGGARAVTVKRIESRRRKQEQVVAGAEAGVVLDGIGIDDIPTQPGGHERLIDHQGMRGIELVGF